MKKNKIKKRMKADQWNERNRNLEEQKTKEEDNDWNKKNNEEQGEYENEFHEEVYDK